MTDSSEAKVANDDTGPSCAQALCCVSSMLNTLLREFSSSSGLEIVVPILQTREWRLITGWDWFEARAPAVQILSPVGFGFKSLLHHLLTV